MSEILRNELFDKTGSESHADFLAGLGERQLAELRFETDKAAIETETAGANPETLAEQILQDGTGGCLGTGVLIAQERRLREILGLDQGGGRCP